MLNSQKLFLSGAFIKSLQLREDMNCPPKNDLIFPCLHQLFEQQVERTPDNIAITFAGKQLTYYELNYRANQLAHHLQAMQVGPEVLVGICIDRSLEMVIGLLGILKAGGAYVPLDPTYPQERLSFKLHDSQLSVLVTQQNLLGKLPDHAVPTVCLDIEGEQIGQAPGHNPNVPVTPDHLAYVIYTSGSTGQPKGVEVLHRGVSNFMAAMQQQPGLVESDVLLAVTTISFDIAALELYLPLTVGAQVALVSREVAADATRLQQAIDHAGATVMQATPATWRMLLAGGWQGNSQLKVLSGGEALSKDLADQLRPRVAAVWNLYGPTEATIWATVHQVEPDETVISIGRPIANTQIYLVDPEPTAPDQPLQLVAPGAPGELLIGGIGLARGYLNRPELTAAKFIANPFIANPFSADSASAVDSPRLYRTGDLARTLPDGTIVHLGRIDHQVKIRGFRIELGEIEAVLHTHAKIREAVVVAREDNSGEQCLVAYLVPTTEALPVQELRTLLRTRLPEHMVPSAFVVMKALPLTPNGKVDRRALPAPDHTRPDLPTTFVAPRSPIEVQLTRLWQRVLDLEQVGIHDNFFELGGHSLLAAQLLTQVRETFQVELPLTVLFQDPTIAGLAEAINIVNDSTESSTLMAGIAETLQADMILDDSIYPSHAIPERILLTGATGFLGAFLVYELLQQTQAQIYCLVRSSNLAEAQQKIAANLKGYRLPAEGLKSRIVPVLGDLSQPNLGLSEPQFQALAAEIDVIYHNGALVNLVYPYQALRAANVLGTREILKLASLTKIKPVHFVSTLDVFQSAYYAEKSVILEADHPAFGQEPGDGYAQSKWVAEKLVMSAHARGIPVCIYRPGMITGDSQTGALQPNDLVSRLIKGLAQLGLAPDLALKMSLTPVDYVSRAIVHLSRRPASWGKAFHLVSPQALSFRELVQEIQNFGYPIEWTTYDQWQAQLLKMTAQQGNALSPLLFLFTDWGSEYQLPYLKTSALVSQAFDCQNTLAGLVGTDIRCPIIDAHCLQTYFSHLIPKEGDLAFDQLTLLSELSGNLCHSTLANIT